MREPSADRPVALRDYPYPYAALLTICSDLDETLDEHTYLETIRYLASTERTVYGAGLGLELGNTIYFDMPPGHFSYWSASDGARDRIRALIRSGHIDCLHSFGDLAYREHAARALEELDGHGCRIRVWIDHAVAPTNFGHDIMHGQGDIEGSRAFHADLSTAFGIRYVWCGRVTSVIGQDTASRLAGIGRWAAPLASAQTLSKELVKRELGRLGMAKYRMHASNRLLTPRTLASGQSVVEFLRANSHWAGVSVGETGEGLGEVATEGFLDTLERRRGVAVLYTHLGKGNDRARPLGARTLQALEALADRQRRGQVLVTSTAKLLGYCETRDALQFRVEASDGGWQIEARTAGGASAVEGLTFYTDRPTETRLSVDGAACPLVSNPPDRTGRASVSVVWHRAHYPL